MKNHQTKSETGKFLGFRIKYEYEQLRKWAIIKICKTLKTDTNYIYDQIASFRNELRTARGFMWESWNEAAQWCAQHNTNLDEALMWADTATSRNFGGDKSFQAWTTKSQVLQKLNRTQEAAELMKKNIAYWYNDRSSPIRTSTNRNEIIQRSNGCFQNEL